MNVTERQKGSNGMKSKDLVIIILVATVSAIFSFVISGFLFNSSESRQEQVEVVEAINSEFIEPNTKYFNKDSINPTRTITVQEQNNKKPFDGEQ